MFEEFVSFYKKHKRILLKYYVRNAILTFIFMSILMMIAISSAIIYLDLTNQEYIIHGVFIQHIPELALSIVVLSFFFTIGQALVSYLAVRQPIKEFAKASKRVVHGDYTTQIDIENTSFGSLEFINIANNFNQMVKELGKIDSISNDFISNISHEIKTPLSVIQSYAMILQNPLISNEEKKEYIEKILFSTQQLSTLVSNILKLNKMENEQIKPKKIKYNLSSQLIQCLLDLEDLWDEKNLVLDIQVDDDKYINSDQELLNLVWMNLFSNAIKFTPKDGKISVILKEYTDRTDVIVSDSGCGMTEETKAHIFEKFYQGDTSHSEKGNGLGLALVKRIIDITDSKISVDSILNNGTTFTVSLYK